MQVVVKYIQPFFRLIKSRLFATVINSLIVIVIKCFQLPHLLFLSAYHCIMYFSPGNVSNRYIIFIHICPVTHFFWVTRPDY